MSYTPWPMLSVPLAKCRAYQPQVPGTIPKFSAPYSNLPWPRGFPLGVAGPWVLLESACVL